MVLGAPDTAMSACGVGCCGEWIEMRPEKSAGVLNAMLRSEHSPKGRASHERGFKQGRYTVPFMLISICLAVVRRMNCKRGKNSLKVDQLEGNCKSL